MIRAVPKNKLNSRWERWQFYRVVWEGVTEKVTSEHRLKVVREHAVWTSEENHSRQGEQMERP